MESWIVSRMVDDDDDDEEEEEEGHNATHRRVKGEEK